MRDAVIDVDVATSAARGFFGPQFRIDSVNGEWIYLRQHKSGAPDAMQYTPVLNTGLNWQLYNGPGFTGAVEVPRDTWFHLRLEVAGAQARFFVKDMQTPRTHISVDRAQVKKLLLGYSDDVGVFLNGQILYRGRSAQNFRDPAFLGILNPENDVLYLPLKKGDNDLTLAVSELGGGWGFICRLADLDR